MINITQLQLIHLIEKCISQNDSLQLQFQQYKDKNSLPVEQNIDELYDQIIQKLQKPGSLITQPKVKRLYVDGVFDMTHSGHYNALRQAKQYCETLVVGVVSEKEVIKNKGSVPLMTEKERISLAQNCKWADEIVPGVPYFPDIEFLDSLNCSHICHGDDFILDQDGRDAYSIFRDVNRMIVFKRTEGISTTDIVGRLLTLERQPDNIHKHMRKISGDQGIQAQQVDEQDFSKDEYKEIASKTYQRLQLINTSRKIKQFSDNNKVATDQDKVVYISGGFDVLNSSHLQALEKAKQLGTYLIVGIHSDTTIQGYKSSKFPILNISERTLSMLAQRLVDEVIIGAPLVITSNMIKMFNIKVVVESPLEEINSPEAFEIPKKLGIH